MTTMGFVCTKNKAQRGMLTNNNTTVTKELKKHATLTRKETRHDHGRNGVCGMVCRTHSRESFDRANVANWVFAPRKSTLFNPIFRTSSSFPAALHRAVNAVQTDCCTAGLTASYSLLETEVIRKS